MKTTFMALLILSFNSLASDLGACSKDNYMNERINDEVPKDERISLYNKKEYVGVLQVYMGELVALYLCGDNSGYYYVDGAFEDLINGESVLIYNDEYDVSIKKIESLNGYTKVFIYVDGNGARDYENFSSMFEFKTKYIKKLLIRSFFH